MLTDLQRRKLKHMFDLYDTNQDQVLERVDYELIVERVAHINGIQPGSAEYARLLKERLAIWDNVRQLADSNKDNRVTLEEFQAGYDRLLSNQGTFAGLMSRYADASIQLADKDGDGRLSEQEFTTNLRGYNVTEDGAAKAFRRLDLNGDGYLTRDEILKHVDDFYNSDDPEAPGNWLLGPY